MWAIAIYDLRLAEEAFGDMDPRRFSLLLDRDRLQQKLTDQRFGILAAILVNSVPTGKKARKPAKPSDFFPSLK